VLVYGALLYLVKVVHDPYTFTFSDEWIHEYKAATILHDGTLFQPNSILPVTARYPGLETVTAAFAALSGLSIFASGLVVVAVARAVVMLSLFLLVERLTRSPRIAGLAALLYASNPNFVLWSGQFSYESLALPLVVLTFFLVVAKMTADDPGERAGWTGAALLVISMVVITHHISAYALTGLLLAICVACVVRKREGERAPWLEAGFAASATLAWLHWVAPVTGDYLAPVFRKAYHQTIEAATGSTHVARAPFQAAAPGEAHASLGERGVAIAAVSLIAIGVPLGLILLWRRHRSSPVLLLLGLAGLVYLAVLPARLVPAAWETSNRASEFLFIGVALLLALVAASAWSRWRPFRIAFPALASILVVGGLVAGWPPRVILSHPYDVAAGANVIEPSPEAAARWSEAMIGRRNRIVAPEALSRVLLGHGGQLGFATRSGFNARDLLFEERVTPSVVATLRANHIGYVAIDRRRSADDNMAGYFFTRLPTVTRAARQAAAKWDNYPGVDRVFDNGAITVYDVRRLSHATAQ
jgi:4-amino-4-deoxy-L-arabinose transferase-like glycosyltransferase